MVKLIIISLGHLVEFSIIPPVNPNFHPFIGHRLDVTDIAIYPQLLYPIHIEDINEFSSIHSPILCSNDLGNYGPISFVYTFSKFMEKVVYSKITDDLDRNEIKLEKQYGFILNKSTLTALIVILEYIVDLLKEEENYSGNFLDLSKAFDCLS